MTLPLESYREIPLTRGLVAKVSAEDYDRLSQEPWHSMPRTNTHNFDAVRHIGTRAKQWYIKMHRVIMGVTDPRVKVDHINGDTLDNRRENLRVCSQSQNAKNRRPNRNNTSGYKGVHKIKDRDSWMAYVKVNYVHIHLGCFSSAEEAAKAYDNAARQHFGEFARTNFPA